MPPFTDNKSKTSRGTSNTHLYNIVIVIHDIFSVYAIQKVFLLYQQVDILDHINVITAVNCHISLSLVDMCPGSRVIHKLFVM